MRFDHSEQIAWRSIPGQVALSAVPRTTPLERLIVADGNPHGTAVGDFNGDSRDDVVVVRPFVNFEHGAVDWWERTGPGEWVEHSVSEAFEGGYFAGVGDVDGDGDTDILVAAYWGGDPPGRDVNGRDGRYVWFENLQGDGSAWSEHVVGSWFWGAQHLETADIDGDGDQDLLGASSLTSYAEIQSADVVWFENLDGQGEDWVQHEVETDLPLAKSARAVDLDGDLDLDIVSGSSDNIFWYENLTGDGTEWTRHRVGEAGSGFSRYDVGDIDSDGDLDFVGACYVCPTLTWWENSLGDATQWIRRDIGPGGTVECVELADVEGDGDLDLLIAQWGTGPTGAAGWIENLDGVGLAWTGHLLKLGLEGDTWIASGDIDHDGKLDAVVQHAHSGDGAVDDITWFDLSTFVSQGELVSSVLEARQEARWESIAWDAELPFSSTLVVELRASDDPLFLGDWVTVPQSPADLGALIDPFARYLQYRISASTSSAAASPVLEEIRVTDVVDPTGAAETLSPGGSRLLGSYPNPTRGGSTISFLLEADRKTGLRVFDLRGALVREISLASMRSGAGSVQWDGRDSKGRTLPAGVYFLRLEREGRILDSDQIIFIR